MVSRACFSWMRPIGLTRFLIFTRWKLPTHAASSGWALMRTAALDRLTWPRQGSDGSVDWEKLRQQVVLSTIFLDDVVEANAYVPAVPQLKEAAHRARRIGLGIMGLGDLMYHAGIRYGSEEGQEFSAQVMEFVRYHTMLTSIELAEQREHSLPSRAAFMIRPILPGSLPQPWLLIKTIGLDLPVDWSLVVEGIRKNGIRNAAQTTVAPTGNHSYCSRMRRIWLRACLCIGLYPPCK
jgi:ribonucleotide reductase alpha subunit